MNSVDTNVVVRFLTKDDPKQYEVALNLFAQGKIFISHTVLLETEWVLRYSYGFDRGAIEGAFAKLLRTDGVTVLDEYDIFNAIFLYGRHGLDFGDALHLCKSKHCSSFCTFDQDLARKAIHFATCKVDLLKS